MAKQNELLNTICDALGLPKTVRALNIDLRAGDIPEVTVELLLPTSVRAGMATFEEQLLTYKLVPANDETTVADFERAVKE